MGRVQWGMAMDRDTSPIRLAASVVPALVAWAWFFSSAAARASGSSPPPSPASWPTTCTPSARVPPPWYPHLRWPLTAIVVACLLVASVNA